MVRARDVLDYIAYIQLVDQVNALSDSAPTALTFLPAFMKGCAAARRGQAVFPLSVLRPGSDS